MKLRTLKKLLNDTEYIVNRDTEYTEYGDGFAKGTPRICIGSPMVHDLIAWNVSTKKLKAISYLKNGFDKKSELELIWNKMQELSENGTLEEIASGNDELKDPIPVFTFREHKIIKTFTERNEFGWPNIDNEGYLMHENTSFRTKQECMDYAICNMSLRIRYDLENLTTEFERITKLLKHFAEEAKSLEDIYSEMRKNENTPADRKPDGM